MNRLFRLFYYICLALLLWLADALLMSFSGQLGLSEALWGSVAPQRLLLRLFLSGFILLWGLINRHYRRLSPAYQRLLFGDQNSASPAVRMHYHCLRLAALMHLRPSEQEALRLLCYCHDIGLVGVPDSILEKEGKLSREEQDILDRHIDLGAKIAANIPQLRRASTLILSHEEYYNGGGAKAMYGRSIPLSCRIFKLVQMYDYFTHPHDGGRVLEPREALDELDLYSGQILDPDVVDAFRRLMTDQRLAGAVTQYIFSS
ncbi:MAG: HD domain-containing phosphohydrolase [Bacillota bacterium]|nr:HD domain-containing phosphohydrolase [Bacillota bacterium]